MTSVSVIGAGLAGSEAAWQLAQLGIKVKLIEMRPQVSTPAHETGYFAELVCSNSLGSTLESTAGGLLKKELQIMGSLIIKVAEENKVPAGGALAVNRTLFAQKVTHCLTEHPNIEIIKAECTKIPDGVVVIASGPLTSPALAASLSEFTQSDNLYFYDAAAPIVYGESVDYNRGFWAARYDQGTADYFNCPLTKSEYEEFIDALTDAEEAPLHTTDLGKGDLPVFEGCMPLEVMAKRGIDALRYGPFRPVGLEDASGARPYAILQLRLENSEGSLLNLVGCQTRLKWGEQKRVFRLIPALWRAEFARYGVMHRNTFINSPRVLNSTFQSREAQELFMAGQITGVEGYVESTASGLLAGINAARFVSGQNLLSLPLETMLGSLAHYISTANAKHFQPMNANFGILPTLEPRVRGKKERKMAYSHRSLNTLQAFWSKI